MIIPDLSKAFSAIERAARARYLGQEVLVPASKRTARLKACAACPELDRDGQCRVCTCFVSAKSRLATETCPLKKWPA